MLQCNVLWAVIGLASLEESFGDLIYEEVLHIFRLNWGRISGVVEINQQSYDS